MPNPEPGDTLLPGAGSWTVPFSDFTPPDNPFALELRAETIEQLVGGDALRRGESERIEAGRSEANADLVAGRDRVHVHGRLDEHTGHGLAQQVAHLDTTVDGTLDLHAGMDDTVLLAGHMKDVWDGGTAIVAAVADDLVAGGGVRVTAPLDLWLHGVMGVEERIGTCTADAVLMELSATHYEREYGPGVHAVGLALYTGSLYQSTRSTFWPLMRVSSGVRNLIAGGGGGGAGGAPGASPPPAPAAGGAGTEAASATLSTASGSARSVESVVEAGADSEDLAGVHRFADASDAVHADEFTPTNPELVAQLDDLLAEISRWGDESGDLTELNRSADSADQLAALQREEIAQIDTMLNSIDQQILEIRESVLPQPSSVVVDATPPPVGGTDDLRHSVELSDAHSPVPDLDRTPAESPEIPDWEQMFYALSDELMDHRWSGNQPAADAHQAAVDAIAGRVMTTFHQFGGTAEDLYPSTSQTTQAITARRILEEMVDRARQADDWQRADEIVQTLQEIDQHTHQIAVDLRAPPWQSARAGADLLPPTRGSADVWGGPPVHEPEVMGYETVGPGILEPADRGSEAVGGDLHRIAGDSDSSPTSDAGSSLDPEPASNSDRGPVRKMFYVLDWDRQVYLSAELYEEIRDGVARLEVVNLYGQPVANGTYTLFVEGEQVAELGDLHRIDSPRDWRSGSPGSSGDPHRYSFGPAQPGEASGFGHPETSRLDSQPFSFREKMVNKLMRNEALAVDEEIATIRRRFNEASRTREIDLYTPQWESMARVIAELEFRADFPNTSWNLASEFNAAQWQAMDDLLRLFDTPNRPPPS